VAGGEAPMSVKSRDLCGFIPREKLGTRQNI
jgi:hypothetical protein